MDFEWLWGISVDLTVVTRVPSVEIADNGESYAWVETEWAQEISVLIKLAMILNWSKNVVVMKTISL